MECACAVCLSHYVLYLRCEIKKTQRDRAGKLAKKRHVLTPKLTHSICTRQSQNGIFPVSHSVFYCLNKMSYSSSKVFAPVFPSSSSAFYSQNYNKCSNAFAALGIYFYRLISHSQYYMLLKLPIFHFEVYLNVR